MQLTEAIRELWRSWVGKGGVLLLITLFAGAGYVLATYPLDYGDRIWSNPNVWVDNPKAAAPTWTNLWRDEPEPAHLVLTAGEPDNVREAAAGKLESYRLPFTFDYTHPPSFLAITLGDVLYAERPPLIDISLLRPDGRSVRLLRHAVRGPREGEVGPYERYTAEPLRIQLSTDESTIGGLQEFLAAEFDLTADTRELRGVVDRALFGTPTGEGLTFDPLTGDYAVVVEAAFRNPDDQLGLVRFVAGGAVYGWMGTDTLGRNLAEGLLFGLPVALFIGLVVAVVETAIGTALGITSGYIGGRTDLAIQRAADIVANVPVLPLLIFMLFIIGPSLGVLLFVLIAFSWPGLTIQIRSMVLHMRTNALVEAIQSLGAGHNRVMFRHILPQIAPYVVSRLIFAAPSAILAEAGLSFLGLGDPSIPTWGQILEAGFRTGGVYVGYWWWIVPPGLLIVLTALTFMLLSLGLEPVVNPRLRRSR
ncbi:MAG TPA: ABC transporter permease [Caldilineaceae bacterium]|mgnify:CR=1 FL=1|nr:ABC transporter permease [Caldilineaceae bacterium]